MKKIVIIALGLVMGTTTFAQEIETTVSADVVSNYIGRRVVAAHAWYRV